MPFRRIIFLAVAIGLSFATTLVVRDWVVTARLAAAPTAPLPAPVLPAPPAAAQQAPAPPSPLAVSSPVSPPSRPPTEVLVAARALPSGHLLAEDDVRWQAWPDDDVAGAYIVKSRGLDGLQGSVVREAIAAGEPITGERLVRRGDRGFLAALLTPGRRAITIAIAANPLLTGLVAPGDRVDLLCTMLPSAEGGQRKSKPPVTETLMHDIKLLALDQRLDDHPGDFPTPHTATLEVTPKQAEMIALAADRAKFSLSLRSNTTPEASEDEPGPLAWDDAPEPPLAPPLRTEPVAGGKVSIIRGGSISELDFAHPAK